MHGKKKCPSDIGSFQLIIIILQLRKEPVFRFPAKFGEQTTVSRKV